MQNDTLKLIFTYAITLAILAGGFYALVIYPYELAELVKGALLGFMGAAIAFVYGDNAASRTAVQQQKAFDAGVQTPTPSVTADASAPAPSTVAPGPPATPVADWGQS